MIINKVSKATIISLMLLSITSPAHGWWLSDWLFGKPNTQQEVKTHVAATQLLAVASAAFLLPTCFLGWKWYSASKKNDANQIDLKRKTDEIATLQAEKTTLNETLSDSRENATQWHQNFNALATEASSHSLALEHALKKSKQRLQQQRACTKFALNAHRKSKSARLAQKAHVAALEQQADQFYREKTTKKMLHKWQRSSQKAYDAWDKQFDAAVEQCGSSAAAKGQTAGPAPLATTASPHNKPNIAAAAAVAEAQRQAQIDALSAQTQQRLYGNGRTPAPSAASLARRRPGINNGQHVRPPANTLTKAQLNVRL